MELLLNENYNVRKMKMHNTRLSHCWKSQFCMTIKNNWKLHFIMIVKWLSGNFDNDIDNVFVNADETWHICDSNKCSAMNISHPHKHTKHSVRTTTNYKSPWIFWIIWNVCSLPFLLLYVYRLMHFEFDFILSFFLLFSVCVLLKQLLFSSAA